MAPTKGELTRERILATAAPLFNRLGYAGASMADLMAAAGLEKGGIYRHFASKKAIAVAAFDHAVRLHNARILAYLATAPADATSRLIAVAEGMASIVEDPAIEGGCPLLNTAIESDDAEGPLYPALRARTRRAMAHLLGIVRGIVAEGVASGEFRVTTDVHAEASGVVAAMEGALMLTKLYDDPVHIQHAVERVRERTKVLARCAG
jgi:TetR/AcrR family transcriptional repressor of nem operon